MEGRSEVTREDVVAVQQRLELLKVAFEKFFIGIDKRPPLAERTAIQRKILEFTRAGTRNTAIRYQVSRLKDSLVVYSAYWDRILRQIEEGTYSREQFKLRTKLGAPTPLPSKAEAPGPKSVPASESEDVVKVYRSYLFARKKCNEPTEGITQQKIASLLKRQEEQLRSRVGANASIEFKVAIKDGKAVILAKTTKPGA